MHIWLFSKTSQHLDDFPSLIPLSAVISLHVKEKPDFVCDLGVIAVFRCLFKVTFSLGEKPYFGWNFEYGHIRKMFF